MIHQPADFVFGPSLGVRYTHSGGCQSSRQIADVPPVPAYTAYPP